MALTTSEKQNLIKKYQLHEGDTGSPEVQISILTDEVKKLSEHLKEHKKDNHSRRGLLQKVGKRRRLLQYLEANELERFEALKKKLDI